MMVNMMKDVRGRIFAGLGSLERPCLIIVEDRDVWEICSKASMSGVWMRSGEVEAKGCLNDGRCLRWSFR